MNNSNYSMVDVGEKALTSRRARASGRIRMDREAFVLLKNAELPKGDVLPLAESAGIQAAKHVSQALPLCHPLPLDAVTVSFQLLDNSNEVLVECEVRAKAKTGVEMEALAGVQVALLCIYDLTKGVCPALSISDIRLLEKEGGKRGYWVHPEAAEERPAETDELPQVSLMGRRAAVLTVSDSSYNEKREDRSGPLLRELLIEAGAQVLHQEVLPDEPSELESFLFRFSLREPVDLILTSGGTGIGPRDITPDAVLSVLDIEIPGIGEELRRIGLLHTPTACLSRSVAGLLGQTLIVTLPGNPKAIEESKKFLLEILPHAFRMLEGEGHIVNI